MRSTLLMLFLLAGFVQAEETPLPTDPALTTGTLPNGLRYWIQPNATPPGKVSILLHVHSGSLNESEEQRGLAHYLEHMAFNGSKHFPPGEMVKFFESLGMRFGQHQNAFTGFDQTTYLMHLPDTKPGTIEKTMLYLADVGFRLLLGEEEIDKERGVILEEKRSRAGVGQRIMDQALPIIVPGSRLAERMPIGLESVIRESKRDRFVDYYTTWYRPDNATVIVCGDIDVETIRGMIAKKFADWKPAENPKPDYPTGVRFHEKLEAAVITDPELTEVSIGFSCLRPREPDAHVSDLRRDLAGNIGIWIANRRLSQMLQKGEAPFQSANLRAGDFLGAAMTVDVEATGAPERWQEMLTAVVTETKRAREHGFREDEIELAKKAIVANVELAARRAPTRATQTYIMAMNSAVTEGRIPMSAAQSEELVKKLLPTITADQIQARFRELYRFDRGLVLSTAPRKEGVEAPTKEGLLAVFGKAVAAEVAAGEGAQSTGTLLEKDPEPAPVAARTIHQGLQVESLRLANNARVHLRTMTERKDAVVVTVRFIGGMYDETAKTAQYTGVGSIALRSGTAATGRLSSSELSDLTTGKKFGFGGIPDDGSLVFTMIGAPDDLEEGFRVLHALLTDPKLESAPVDRWKLQTKLQLSAAMQDLGFRAENAVGELMSGGDPRVMTPSTEHIDAMDRAAAEAWLKQVLRRAPIEVSIVGDLPRARMSELARTYIGTLPKRDLEREDLATIRRVAIKDGPFRRRVEVETKTERAEVRLGWRGAAATDRHDARVLLFGSFVANSRLTKEIREDRGLTYSIQCASVPGALDGMGRFLVQFTADVPKADEATKIARQVVLDMIGDKPPTDAEIDAVKSQIRNILETQLKQPRFWADSLSWLRTNGRQVDDLTKFEANYMGITKEEIIATLKKYLKDERYYEVIAVPKGE